MKTNCWCFLDCLDCNCTAGGNEVSMMRPDFSAVFELSTGSGKDDGVIFILHVRWRSGQGSKMSDAMFRRLTGTGTIVSPPHPPPSPSLLPHPLSLSSWCHHCSCCYFTIKCSRFSFLFFVFFFFFSLVLSLLFDFSLWNAVKGDITKCRQDTRHVSDIRSKW